MAITDSQQTLDLMGGIGAGGVEAGVGAATGNPIALIAGIAGIATSIFGAVSQSNVQQQESQASQQIAQDEEKINKQKQTLAMLTYRRQSIENMRKAQQSRALARAAGVEGGVALGSSGVQGGEAQAGAEGAFNQLNLEQEFKIGQNIFGITSDINAQKIRLAQLGGQAATDAGISAIGQDVTGGAMALGRLSGGFGGKY